MAGFIWLKLGLSQNRKFSPNFIHTKSNLRKGVMCPRRTCKAETSIILKTSLSPDAPPPNFHQAGFFWSSPTPELGEGAPCGSEKLGILAGVGPWRLVPALMSGRPWRLLSEEVHKLILKLG